MTIAEHRIAGLAVELEQARAELAVIQPPSDRFEIFALSDGYAVGAAVEALRVQDGRQVAGQKIGLTYPANWERIGITHPVWAPIYSENITEDVNELSIASLLAPKIEVEVVVGFDLPVPLGASLDQVIAAAAWVALGYELVDCHFPDWKLTPPDMVSDFGCHAGLFIGPRRATAGEDLLSLSALEVTLCCDGVEVAVGTGKDVVGGPVQAVEVLLSSPGARAIAAGDIVTTGALTRMAHSASSGQTWTATTSGFGTLDSIKLVLV